LGWLTGDDPAPQNGVHDAHHGKRHHDGHGKLLEKEPRCGAQWGVHAVRHLGGGEGGPLPSVRGRHKGAVFFYGAWRGAGTEKGCRGGVGEREHGRGEGEGAKRWDGHRDVRPASKRRGGVQGEARVVERVSYVFHKQSNGVLAQSSPKHLVGKLSPLPVTSSQHGVATSRQTRRCAVPRFNESTHRR